MLRAKQSQVTSNKISAWLDTILTDAKLDTTSAVVAGGDMTNLTYTRKPSTSPSIVRSRRLRRRRPISAPSIKTTWF
ncbi:MAG: hypothetical protein HKO02_10890 [Hyphomonadaceae bacterium]|nr:hypothetical protein [Hyphomonadaceae bacterium]